MTTRSWRYRIGSALPLGIIACLCSICATDASAANWNLTQVDNSADVGKFVSSAVDSNNKLHISYFDAAGKLKYTTNNSGSWPETTTTVLASGVVSAGTAIAIEAETNLPQINYYYGTGKSGIKTILYNGTSWGSPISINGNFDPAASQSTSLVNKGGYSHLLFVKNAGAGVALLNYTKNGIQNDYTSYVTPSVVDTTNFSGTNNSLAVGSAGKPHVVGYNSSSTDLFYYTTDNTGAWQRTTLAASSTADIGKHCALAVDGSDNLHLVYVDATAGRHIMYRFKSPTGSWEAPVDVGECGALGGYSSIAVDSAGKPHISYYYSATEGSGKLRYATNADGAWSGEDVDTSANVGQYSSITVDKANTVNIAYYDVTNSALKVASAVSSTPTISFGSVDRGFQSAPVTITVTSQATAVNIGKVAKSGLNVDDFFIESDSCSNVQLAPQASCAIVARFTPLATAPRSTARNATISVPRSAPYSALAYILTGTTSANFLVTASASNGGSISPTKVAVAPNANQSFTVSADTNFSVASVLVDGTTPLTAPDYTLANVNADHTVVASLASAIRVLESSIFYGSLQAAFGVVNPGWTIQTQNVIPAGDLLVDRDVAVTLSGGYDSAFASQTGLTSLPGSIVVSNGTLAVENIVIQ